MAEDLARLAVDVDHLTRPGGILDTLEALLPEPVTDPSSGGTRRKVAGSPALGDARWARAIYDAITGGPKEES